jgi:hypothetical protein
VSKEEIMSDSDYKETEMAELRMTEFVSTSITLERIVCDREMTFQVKSPHDRNGDRERTSHDSELAAKIDFLTRVREALALPEGTY